MKYLWTNYLVYLILLGVLEPTISSISNLQKDSLIHVEKLYLNGNEITKIKNLNDLNVLSLSKNQIEKILGIEHLKHLTFLYLSNNKITEIKGIPSLTNLIELNLNDNYITEIKGLQNLTKLKELNSQSIKWEGGLHSDFLPILYIVYAAIPHKVGRSKSLFI